MQWTYKAHGRVYCKFKSNIFIFLNWLFDEYAQIKMVNKITPMCILSTSVVAHVLHITVPLSLSVPKMVAPICAPKLATRGLDCTTLPSNCVTFSPISFLREYFPSKIISKTPKVVSRLDSLIKNILSLLVNLNWTLLHYLNKLFTFKEWVYLNYYFVVLYIVSGIVFVGSSWQHCPSDRPSQLTAALTPNLILFCCRSLQLDLIIRYSVR